MQATRVHKEEVVDREGLTYVENPAGEKLLLSGNLSIFLFNFCEFS